MKNNCFKEDQLQENTDRQVNDIRKTIHEEIQRFNREIEITRSNQKVILRNTMNEMRIVTESINNRLDQVKERISDLKDRSFEIFQLEEKKVKRYSKRSEEAYVKYRTPSNKIIFALWEFQKEKRDI